MLEFDTVHFSRGQFWDITGQDRILIFATLVFFLRTFGPVLSLTECSAPQKGAQVFPNPQQRWWTFTHWTDKNSGPTVCWPHTGCWANHNDWPQASYRRAQYARHGAKHLTGTFPGQSPSQVPSRCPLRSSGSWILENITNLPSHTVNSSKTNI